MPTFELSTPVFGPPSTELAKPPVPYTAGWRFTAKSHLAPAATPVVRNCCINSDTDRIEKRQLCPVDRCLEDHPLPGKEGNDTVTLEAIDL